MQSYGIPAGGVGGSADDGGMDGEALDSSLGVTYDPNFGPLLKFGWAGVDLEIFGEVVFALHPVTDLDVERMLTGMRTFPLFGAYQGRSPRDVPALKETLLRLSQLVEDHPQIRQIDLHPLKVMEQGRGCRISSVRVQAAAVDPYAEYVLSRLMD